MQFCSILNCVRFWNNTENRGRERKKCANRCFNTILCVGIGSTRTFKTVGWLCTHSNNAINFRCSFFSSLHVLLCSTIYCFGVMSSTRIFLVNSAGHALGSCENQSRREYCTLRNRCRTIGVNNGSRLVTGKIDWYRFHLSLAKRPSPYANWRHDLVERYILCGMCDPFEARANLCDQINRMTSYYYVEIVDILKLIVHIHLSDQSRYARALYVKQSNSSNTEIQYVYSNDMQII